MDTLSPTPHRLPLIALAMLGGAGIVAGAFYGWMRFGSSILLTLAENGLSGCL
ncbi:hypothetical protein [Pseudorhizobium endolithicum]|uniref:hypothetical protein n=1 Tax=Pseudorhizobium endolithicum TaxID=1191678 RepID=UPI00163B714F|nr:hypothetical protein [Pseudorhizobium endolithicum]